MGLFEKIFKYQQDLKQASTIFKTLTGYTPVFTSWNGMIYESLLVRAAIHARATHVSKLRIVFHGAASANLVEAAGDAAVVDEIVE